MTSIPSQKWIFVCVLIFTCASALKASPAFASPQDEETAEIFNKSNRVLDPPPKALRANSESLDYRLKAESQRIDRIPAQDNPDSENSASADSTSTGTSTRRAKKKRTQDDLSFSGDRSFGIGMVGGGPYGVFGGEADFNITDDWYAGFGVGTGMSYDTWALHSRYFFKAGKFNTFLEMGYANWSLEKVSETGKPVTPNYLAQRFFADANGNLVPGARANLIYPGLGLLYQHRSGIAAVLEAQYLISIANFAGGLFGSLALYYYF